MCKNHSSIILMGSPVTLCHQGNCLSLRFKMADIASFVFIRQKKEKQNGKRHMNHMELLWISSFNAFCYYIKKLQLKYQHESHDTIQETILNTSSTQQ